MSKPVPMPRQTAFISANEFFILIPCSPTELQTLRARYDRGCFKVQVIDGKKRPRRTGTLSDDLPYALYLEANGRLCPFSTARLVTYGVVWPHPDTTPAMFTPWVLHLLAAATSSKKKRSFSMSVGNIVRMRYDDGGNATAGHPCFGFASSLAVTPVHLPRTLPDTKTRAEESKKRRHRDGDGIWCRGVQHVDERKTVSDPVRHLQDLCRGFVPLCDTCRRSVGPVGSAIRNQLAPTGLSKGRMSAEVIKHVQSKSSGTDLEFLNLVLRRYEKMATDRLAGAVALYALFHFSATPETPTADLLAVASVFGHTSIPLWLTRTQCVHMMSRILGDDELGAMASYRQSMTTLPVLGTSDAVNLFTLGFGIMTGDEAKNSKIRTTRHVVVLRSKGKYREPNIYGFDKLRIPSYSLAALYAEPPGTEERAWWCSTLFRMGLGMSRSNAHKMNGLLIEVVCGSSPTASTYSPTFYNRVTVGETPFKSMMVTVHVSDPGELLTFATLDRIMRDAMRAAEGRGRSAESVVVKLVIHACIERAWRGVSVRGLSGSAAMMEALNKRIGQITPRDKVSGQVDRPWRTDMRIMTGSALLVIMMLRDIFPSAVVLKVDDARPLHPDRTVTTMDPAARKKIGAFIGQFRDAIVAPSKLLAPLLAGSPCFNQVEFDVDRFGRAISEFQTVIPNCSPRYVGFGRLIGRAAAMIDGESPFREVLSSSDSRSRSLADFIIQAKRRKKSPSPVEEPVQERLTAPCDDGSSSAFVPFAQHKEPEQPSLSQSFRKEYSQERSGTPLLFEDP